MVGGQLEIPNMQLLSIRGTGLSVYIQNDKGLSVFREDRTSPKEHEREFLFSVSVSSTCLVIYFRKAILLH